MSEKDPTKPTLAIKISGAKGAVSISNTNTSTYADTKGNRTSTSTDTGMAKSKPSLAVPMGGPSGKVGVTAVKAPASKSVPLPKKGKTLRGKKG